MNHAHTCCFTGHRTIPEEHIPTLWTLLLDALETAITEQDCRFFAAGGALGFDTLAALAVLRQRERHPHIQLNLVLPCPEQAKGWPPADGRLYESIRSRADTVAYIAPQYTRGCLFARNRFLVDHSCRCIAYATRDTGGTAYTVAYCRKQGVPVHNLADQLPIRHGPVPIG